MHNYLQRRDFEVNNPDAADILIYTGNKVMYTNAETGGLFANGDTLTGSATGATGTIVDIATVTDEILGSQRKIVYTPVTLV